MMFKKQQAVEIHSQPTHRLQVLSEYGTWVDDVALWNRVSLQDAAQYAQKLKALPGRTVYPRPYRVLDLRSGESVPVKFK